MGSLRGALRWRSLSESRPERHYCPVNLREAYLGEMHRGNFSIWS